MNKPIEFLIANLVFFYGLFLVVFNLMTSTRSVVVALGGTVICVIGLILIALVIERNKIKEVKKNE